MYRSCLRSQQQCTQNDAEAHCLLVIVCYWKQIHNIVFVKKQMQWIASTLVMYQVLD